MAIRFYNTLTKREETFEALEPPIVRMYSCGPTVYDYAHVGNFRSFVFADLVRRFLEVSGYEVIHVMNITDVGHMTDDSVSDGAGEDKMQVAARRLKEAKKSGAVEVGAVRNPDDPYEVAEFYAQAFLEDARRLGIKVASEPDRLLRATRHIAEMQALIEKLIDRGHAYVAPDGVVYYSVESFPAYGRLSGNTVDQLRAGSGGRVIEADQAAKRQPEDFLLWKPDPHHIMKWDSPWGTGYPGWHIECSAMATSRLGRDVIDIHTGGEDLIFPHHECEIAQSCGASGAEHFARFWLHVRFLLVEGEKMSKRKGNFHTVRDVLEGRVTGRPVHPAVLRFELLRSHYRSNMNFTAKGLGDSAQSVRRFQDFVAAAKAAAGGKSIPPDPRHPVIEGFLGALSEDLNLSGAVGVLLPWLATKPDDPAVALGVCEIVDRVLGLLPPADEALSTSTDPDAARVAKLCRDIDAARAMKDWKAADKIRAELTAEGYDVASGRDGTTAKRKLA
jgi:cysteinyl-tRNA synthetase